MYYLCRCGLFLLVLLGFELGSLAASSPDERAFEAAARGFRLGSWDWSEKEFGEFVEKHPKSLRVPEAILFRAESLYNLGRYSDAISLLSTNQDAAVGLADQYLYWIAKSHFQNGDFAAAARSLADLVQHFPESPLRLEAVVDEAAAHARLGEWETITNILERPAGVFQRAAEHAPTNSLVAWGLVWLGEAQFELNDYAAVTKTLGRLPAAALEPALNWRRFHLECRFDLARGEPNAALETITNLIVAAQGLKDAQLRAETALLHAQVLERLKIPDAAIGIYETVLTNAPAEQRRYALLKIAELNLTHGRNTNAVHTLERYVEQTQSAGVRDAAILAIGELQLKRAILEGGTNRIPMSDTNLLGQARRRFDMLLNDFTNSPLKGKALLNKGWCFWVSGNYEQSAEMFRLATEELPFSLDQAVARFKWADAQFQRNDAAGALTNYTFLVTNYQSLSEARERVLEQALYQAVRASIEVTNWTAGAQAMGRLLDWYPNSFAGPQSLVLMGEGIMRQGEPAEAREAFLLFERSFPTHELLSRVRLAVARSYEAERNWAAAVTNYDSWVVTFTNSPELPNAEFARALASFKAGGATNALNLFSGFLEKYPGHELAPWARFWMGNYHFSEGDHLNAAKSYQLVFQNTNAPSSELSYEARMMAGLAAFGLDSYRDAIRHFTNLVYNTNCPLEIRVRAAIGYGDALIKRDSDETNRTENLKAAINAFANAAWLAEAISPTNELVARAQGRIGNCQVQLAGIPPADPQWYAAASNSYRQVLSIPSLPPAAHWKTKIALAEVAEKQAQGKAGDEQKALYQLALNYCLDVINSEEQPDLFWLKEAGSRAARFAETLNQWQLAVNLYSDLQQQIPALAPSWEGRLQHARKQIRE